MNTKMNDEMDENSLVSREQREDDFKYEFAEHIMENMDLRYNEYYDETYGFTYGFEVGDLEILVSFDFTAITNLEFDDDEKYREIFEIYHNVEIEVDAPEELIDLENQIYAEFENYKVIMYNSYKMFN